MATVGVKGLHLMRKGSVKYQVLTPNPVQIIP